MTQEELNIQAETLYDDGEYDKLISLITSLPEDKRSYNLLYMLALAYSDNTEGDDVDNQYNALKTLNKIADYGEYDLKWLYLMAKTYMAIGQEEYAIEYFNKMTKIYNKNTEIANIIDIHYFVDSCKEHLYERALTVIFVALKDASKDDTIAICNIEDNKIGILIPKFNITINIAINHLHKSGAVLEFNTIYSDGYTSTYNLDGDAQTYEKGIADAINKYVIGINQELIEHCKQ